MVRTAGDVTPRVTVLMAVHDGERHLEESVGSILGQSFADFELLVVDDASNDSTPQLLDGIRDARVRVLRNDSQAGLTMSLNRALREARGTYVARQDADDVSAANRFSLQVEFLDRHPEVALLGSAYRRTDDDGTPSGNRFVPQTTRAIRWRLLFLNAFAHSSVMIRRSVLDELGEYDESFKYAQDYELWSRIAATRDVAALREILVSYRRSAASLTATFSGAGDEVDEISRRNVERVLPGMGSQLDRDTAWRLLFGDFHRLERRRALTASGQILAVARAFSRHYRLPRREALAHQAAAAAVLARRLTMLAAQALRRRSPGT